MLETKFGRRLAVTGAVGLLLNGCRLPTATTLPPPYRNRPGQTEVEFRFGTNPPPTTNAGTLDLILPANYLNNNREVEYDSTDPNQQVLIRSRFTQILGEIPNLPKWYLEYNLYGLEPEQHLIHKVIARMTIVTRRVADNFQLRWEDGQITSVQLNSLQVPIKELDT